MHFLLLRIAFNVAFAHLLRLSQRRCGRPMLAAGINYLVAAAACCAWAVPGGWSSHTVALGAVAGFIYVASLLLMLPAMRESGVAVTGAVVQLALMLPVGVAIFRYGEVPTLWQGLGILLTLIALPVLSGTSGVGAGDFRRRLSPLTLVLFLSSGASQVVMKEFAAVRPASDLPLYSASLFVAATLCTFAWIARAGDLAPADGAGNSRCEWAVGSAMGAANVLQLLFLLLALRVLPGVVVFPVSAALGIVANSAASVVFWQERLTRAGWIGIFLACLAVVLLNLR